jgi:hypothetical protein
MSHLASRDSHLKICNFFGPTVNQTVAEFVCERGCPNKSIKLGRHRSRISDRTIVTPAARDSRSRQGKSSFYVAWREVAANGPSCRCGSDNSSLCGWQKKPAGHASDGTASRFNSFKVHSGSREGARPRLRQPRQTEPGSGAARLP